MPSRRQADGSWRLDGMKHYIGNGDEGSVFVTFAATEHDGERRHTAFIVEKGMDGFEVGKRFDTMGLRGNDLRELHFNGVLVPPENVLGEPGEGFRIAMHVLNNGRMSLGTGSVGGAKFLLDRTIDHVKERKQFGRPLADFELVQDKIGWMVSYLFGLESTAYLTCGLVDMGVPDYSLESAMVKVSGTEFLWYAANRCLQLKGGAGYMRDEPYEKILRDTRIFPIFEGANDVMRAFIALSAMKPVGDRLKELGGLNLSDPVGSIGVLAEYVTGRVQREVRPDRVKRLASVTESLLREHKGEVINRQFQQKRLADAGAAAEGLGDVALLAGGLHPVLLEDGGGARQQRDLGVDVRAGVSQALLLELAVDHLALVLAQQALGHTRQALDLVGERVCQRLQRLVPAGDPVGAHLALDAAGHVLGQHADRPHGIAQVQAAQLLEPVAHRLHRRQCDEGAHHVVGALEDREDARVAQDLLVGLIAHVAGAALELQAAVGGVPEELGARHLDHRRLQRVVGHAHVHQAAGEVGRGLQAEQVGDHPADLVLDQLEVGERPAELLALLNVVDRAVEQELRPADRARAEAHAPVVEHVHGDPEALAGLAEHVLRRHEHAVEVQLAQVVAAQAHGVEALADLEAVHALFDDEGGVAALAVMLGGGEGHEHRALVAVADIVLHAVQAPGAVGLALGARVHAVNVGACLLYTSPSPRD